MPPCLACFSARQSPAPLPVSQSRTPTKGMHRAPPQVRTRVGGKAPSPSAPPAVTAFHASHRAITSAPAALPAFPRWLPTTPSLVPTTAAVLPAPQPSLAFLPEGRDGTCGGSACMEVTPPSEVSCKALTSPHCLSATGIYFQGTWFRWARGWDLAHTRQDKS